MQGLSACLATSAGALSDQPSLGDCMNDMNLQDLLGRPEVRLLPPVVQHESHVMLAISACIVPFMLISRSFYLCSSCAHVAAEAKSV